MTKARENSDYTGLAADIVAGDTAARAGRKNLILNGSMQISQRGDYTTATAASHNNYYLDRWRFESGLSQTVQDTGFKQKVVVTSGGTNIVGVRQHIEDKTYNRLLGKTITLSAKVTSNSSDARICSYADGWRVGTAHTGGGSEETLTLTYTVPSSLSVAALILEVAITGSSYSNVAISTGDYIEITDVQLELGSVATDFEHRSYGEELALCARYYQEVYYGGTPSNAGYSNSFGPWLSLPVTMRVSPTVARSTFSGHSFYDYPGANANSSNLVFHAVHVLGMTNTAVRAYYTGSADRLYLEGYITADAEL